MENLVSSVLSVIAGKKLPSSALGAEVLNLDDELMCIKSRRSIKREEKKPRKYRLHSYRSELIRRAQLPGWSLRDLSEWLQSTAKLKISYSTIRRYLLAQPEMRPLSNSLTVDSISKKGRDRV